MKVKETKILTTEELHDFAIDHEEIEIEIWFTLVQSSILVETSAKKLEVDCDVAYHRDGKLPTYSC